VHSAKQINLTQRTRGPEEPRAVLWSSGPLGETFFFILNAQSISEIGIRARAYRPLKIACTIADPDGGGDITTAHLSAAIQYRSLRRVWGGVIRPPPSWALVAGAPRPDVLGLPCCVISCRCRRGRR
jgi:hypothetical protein